MKIFFPVSESTAFSETTRSVLNLIVAVFIAAVLTVFLVLATGCTSTKPLAARHTIQVITTSDPRVKHEEPFNTRAYRVAHNLK
jgi:hypothetical protein